MTENTKGQPNRGKRAGALSAAGAVLGVLLAAFLITGAVRAAQGKSFLPFVSRTGTEAPAQTDASADRPTLPAWPQGAASALPIESSAAPETPPPAVSTEPETERRTEPPTEPPTEPGPETTPPTEPETPPLIVITEPETEPLTEPETAPPTEPPTEPLTEPPTEPLTEPPTEPETEPPTEPAPGLLPDLAAHLAGAGMDESELSGTQLVVVQWIETPDCRIYAYEKQDGVWTAKEEVAGVWGKIGRNGVGPHPGWWNMITPSGYYALGPAMGAAAYEETGLSYHQIVPGDYWVDDPTSKYFSKFYQESWNDRDWYSAEDLYATLKVYYYCIVIQYNTEEPIARDEECAIFFHVKNPDTDEGSGGCVTAEEWVLQFMFRWLEEAQDPHILIY